MRTYPSLTHFIRRLDEAGARIAARELGELLADAVGGGASVGFLSGLDAAQAAAWWRDTVAPRVGSGLVVLLAAESGGRIVGTIQLVFPSYPNGRPRAEVAKLLVHSQYRRQGLGRALMGAIEEIARADDRRLLILDTETGSGAQSFYMQLGWQVAGVIPDYVLGNDGGLLATTVMYRRLE